MSITRYASNERDVQQSHSLDPRPDVDADRGAALASFSQSDSPPGITIHLPEDRNAETYAYMRALDGKHVQIDRDNRLRTSGWVETFEVTAYEHGFRATPVDANGFPNGPARTIQYVDIRTVHVL